MRKTSSIVRPEVALAEGVEIIVDSDGSPYEVKLETITPEMARAYLGINITNRSRSKTTVARYKRDMAASRWRVTGDPIRFNSEGKLFDGQHRLDACIAAGVPFTTFVARGLPPETVDVIDSGRPRMARDVLAMRGFANANLLASAARWLLVMKHGLQSTTESQALLKPSHDEIIDIIQRHPKLEESARLMNCKPKPTGTLPSLLAAVHYVGAEILKVKANDGTLLADHFIHVFTHGEQYYSSQDPALKLREMVISERLRGLKPTVKTSYVTLVYVWNAFAEGRSLPQFKPPQTIAITKLKPELL